MWTFAIWVKFVRAILVFFVSFFGNWQFNADFFSWYVNVSSTLQKMRCAITRMYHIERWANGTKCTAAVACKRLTLFNIMALRLKNISLKSSLTQISFAWIFIPYNQNVCMPPSIYTEISILLIQNVQQLKICQHFGSHFNEVLQRDITICETKILRRRFIWDLMQTCNEMCY